MTATITAATGGTSTPETVLSPYSTEWQSRNIVHDLIGGDIAVSLVKPRPRSGSYDALYLTETDAYACVTLHQAETTFTLSDTDRPRVGMTYVVYGQVRIALDEGTREVWVVTVGFQEVTP